MPETSRRKRKEQKLFSNSWKLLVNQLPCDILAPRVHTPWVGLTASQRHSHLLLGRTWSEHQVGIPQGWRTTGSWSLWGWEVTLVGMQGVISVMRLLVLKLTGETNKISSNTPPHSTPHTHAPHKKNTGLCRGNEDFQLPPWCHPTYSALTGFFLCKDFDSALHKHCSWAGLQKYRVIGKWNCVFVN